MALPLNGILAVALEQAVAAPLCSSRLAEAGARVIKIERAEGDFARAYDDHVHGESANFVWLNRGKESLVLDIKDEADKALLHRILAKADVFIQNLAPGAAARAGFGADELRTRHPRLITCDISGYGEEGPAKDMKAYDFLLQCETGLASLTGRPEGPGRVGVSVCDIAAGMNAHAGILQALFARERDGKGRGVKVSLFDALADWMSVPLLQFDYAGIVPQRVGLAHPTIAPYGAYPTGDGKQLVIAIQNEREWVRFCARVLENASLAEDARFAGNMARLAHRPELDAAILGVFSKLDRAVLAARLEKADIAFGSVNELADLSAHPQLRRVEVDAPSGPVRMPAPPIRDESERARLGAVPAVGEHSAAIRAEFSV